MEKVLVILGPTATGKTDLALRFASLAQGKHLDFPSCELVSCDSRQVYVGLDIGTGKLPGGKCRLWRASPSAGKMEDRGWKKGKGFWEMDGIKIWMYDVCDPKVQFTVKDYVNGAEKVIADILKRKKLPIIVGGTGLYLKALIDGLPNLAIPVDEKLRGELQKFSLQELQNKLQLLSPARWKLLNESDRQNPRRLLRSIELVSMYPYRNTIENLKFKIKNYNLLKVGLTAPREVLKKRIFARLLARLDQGLIAEAEGLHRKGLSLQRMKELGLEYGILADFLQKKINKDQLVQILGTKICQYAKRQMTWFQREKDVIWFDITDHKLDSKVEKRLASWYHSTDD